MRRIPKRWLGWVWEGALGWVQEEPSPRDLLHAARRRAFYITLGVGILGLATGAILAATTYTAPPPASSRSGTWAPNRYATPVDGLLVIDVATTTVADQTIALDSDLAGYLQRIVYSHDGDDSSWKLYVKDAAGVSIYSDVACDATADPASAIPNYGTGGVPFAGGLSVQIADADDGTGSVISVRLYIREAWRR